MLTFAPLCSAAEFGTERFAISVGAFITDRDTETRVDSTVIGTGTTIVLENDLGLDSHHTVGRIDGYFRFSESHRIDFGLYDLSRDSTRIIDREIQFEDQIFLIDTSVSTKFDMEVYRLAYSYAFWLADKGFLGADIGFHVSHFSTTLLGTMGGQFASDSFTAPLPTFGLRGEYQITPRLTLNGKAALFDFEIGDIDGRFVDIYVGMDYKLMKNLALGLAYDYVSADIDSVDSRITNLDWQYDGFLLYFKFLFGSVGGSRGQ